MKKWLYLLICGILGIFFLNLFNAFFNVWFHIRLDIISHLPSFLFNSLRFFELSESYVFSAVIQIFELILLLIYQFLIGVIIGLIFYKFRNKPLESVK